MFHIHQPRIFKRFANVRAAQTLRGRTHLPYGFNMSLTVGDSEARVRANRARLAERLGFAAERLATQRQVHGIRVCDVRAGYVPEESDAIVTAEPGWLLAVSIADCIPVLLYDADLHVVAGIHSGWRGTAQNITGVTVEHMRTEYGSQPRSLYAYVGAGAGQCCYEVGSEVAEQFAAGHSRRIGGEKYLFDNPGAVLAQLLACGVAADRIEMDPRCTICGSAFHSYRRDGARSGRMFGVIGMRASTA
ncbi:MAG TPA: peptidoglycan editing factor PgeF [Candidatus Kapabacteria bacterium]|nr:peptidoglycan editing factor PgeF [Candidatus Kapabacteria bacterium]